MPKSEDRNLALELVRVTEVSALAASEWIGKGDKIAADRVAVDKMRERLMAIDFKGEIVAGEGRKDKAPQLYEGELVGNGKEPEIDLVVDPLECTDSVAWGRMNAMAVIAAGAKGSLMRMPDMYMRKIAVGPQAKGKIDLDASVKDNLKKIAKALDKHIEELMVVVLDRPRHQDLIKEIRHAGARVILITDGDVAAAIATAIPESGIDVLMGVGASAEGVQAATALQCLGGEIQGRLQPKNDEEIELCKQSGIKKIDKKLFNSDFAKGDQLLFVATGVIDGPLLKGIRITKDQAISHSVVMRKFTGTVRFIEAHHKLGYEPIKL
ncbi:MAG: fructose-bisphosphatase class II [Candidatus Buchananbacteria bacterium CG10_big_fil_rev_8_21_14_0_10_42_9]|uniref:Fructose-1,6-bisphosphatase n=1 Tax=Candidatus Buchananbacteria bacterium CG10_big_fil_rev_8_21_14_0_10_42_9 TaxID=1974526 RepID=A0A2H0W0M9_9BACT|nr:MAG: fructose-bisphosphatase class II [Candidatus Buchananbacteria bacterium CG10_big_fil_rev_8_21_14_0_10_42_9]